ncbi:MAG: murein transglycosylase A [Sphingomonadaceae bacterium]|nr:murein transglycosylase A [Sphingomonadaceae bacterium]
MLHLTVPAAPGDNAVGAGVRPGPPVGELVGDSPHAERALHAFLISCPSAINQEDRSGLTGAHDWVEPCRAARRWPASDARAFFARHFVAVEVGEGRAFATGYYEPEIPASRTRRPGFEYPFYGRPSDLVERPQSRAADHSGLPSVGRAVDGELVAYYDRAAIEAGALAGQELEIAWARDPVDVFFLQVQGSGVLRLPDGSIMRVGYAGNNGYDYVSIGAVLRERGALEPGETTAQGIAAWLRAHPGEAREVMNANRRYIFMAETGDPAPGGSLGRYVTARATVAVDWNYAPPGAPVILDVDQDIADGVWIAQDTGGAIRGPNRFDTFWGTGAEAFRIAGGMAGRGRAWVLIPRAAARLPGF